ncbi:MAG: hypothetical protein ACT4NY_21060 [Pseudonocardiales bacterium]
MTPVLVELTPPCRTDREEEIIIIDDVDALTDAAVVMGCGDDNPYR